MCTNGEIKFLFICGALRSEIYSIAYRIPISIKKTIGLQAILNSKHISQSAMRKECNAEEPPSKRRQGIETVRRRHNSMTIESGIFRGRRLSTPGVFIRPMMSKVISL